MMKTLFLLFLVTTFSYGQEPDCQKFRTGKYEILDSEHGNIVMVRTKSKITYYNQLSELKTESDIEWINDCTYIIKNSKVLENPKRIEIDLSGSMDTTEIVKTGKDSYTEEYTVGTWGITMPREVFVID